MDPSTDGIQEWQLFYATAAASCATLVGLLFVAFTFKADILSGDKDSWRLLMARRAFGDFILVLMCSLVFLIPHLSLRSLGLTLVIISGESALAILIRVLRSIRKKAKVRLSFVQASRAFGPSFLSNLALVGVSVPLLCRNPVTLDWIFAPMIALIGSAATASWKLLTAQSKTELEP